jgi:adenine-specific DNA-methyltransferase
VVSFSKEDTSYDTQKPEGLLQRIIKASSNDSMIVADFFGGSGVSATVANNLKRNFIHVDVGINSIQTTRDRLIAAKAEFDILEIKDGIALFRNPQQTMDKLASLITGLQRKTNGLSKFWFGTINDSKLGTVPVYVPNLLDHTQKVFDKVTANQLVNQELPELNNIKKVIVYYVDLDDKKEIEEFINEQNNTTIEVELRDLKEVLDDVVIDESIEYKIKNDKKGYKITFNKFVSDRLRQKIDEYNQKGQIQSPEFDLEEENGNGEEVPKKKKKFSPIEISKEGLELIELISLDCTNNEGIWKSDKEIKIDKYGYIIEDGIKSKTFWDATIQCEKKPLRMKVRNIAGDESIVGLS